MLSALLITRDRDHFLSSVVVLIRIYVWLYILYLNSVWFTKAHASK